LAKFVEELCQCDSRAKPIHQQLILNSLNAPKFALNPVHKTDHYNILQLSKLKQTFLPIGSLINGEQFDWDGIKFYLTIYLPALDIDIKNQEINIFFEKLLRFFLEKNCLTSETTSLKDIFCSLIRVPLSINAVSKFNGLKKIFSACMQQLIKSQHQTEMTWIHWSGLSIIISQDEAETILRGWCLIESLENLGQNIMDQKIASRILKSLIFQPNPSVSCSILYGFISNEKAYQPCTSILRKYPHITFDKCLKPIITHCLSCFCELIISDKALLEKVALDKKVHKDIREKSI
jgi:hypothetical protein